MAVLLFPHLPHSCRARVSGRRVKGREAIACDAVGALDVVAVTGTIRREEDSYTPSS
jgi:hypothetical protein